MSTCRCGTEVTTPYCPACGFKQTDAEKAPAIGLLIYLKAQRAKSQQWADKFAKPHSCLSDGERARRYEKQMATVARWDRWIAWVEEMSKPPVDLAVANMARGTNVMKDQPDLVCVCGKTIEGVCPRCGQNMGTCK